MLHRLGREAMDTSVLEARQTMETAVLRTDEVFHAEATMMALHWLERIVAFHAVEATCLQRIPAFHRIVHHD